MEKKKAIPKKKDSGNNITLSFTEPIEVKQIGSSSVELKRNSKGGTEFVIKIYSDNPDKAKEKAIKIYKELNKKFPGE